MILIMNHSITFIIILLFFPHHSKDLKWHPGNYAYVDGNSDYQSSINTMNSKITETFLRGFSYQLKWKAIQQNRNGPYDWSVIDNVLQIISDYNNDNPNSMKYLLVRVKHTTFSGGCTGSTAPIGIAWEKIPVNNPSKCAPKFWEEQTMSDWIKFAKDFGSRYDEHPYFEGLEGGESAQSGGTTYSHQKLTTQLVRMLKECKPDFKYSRFIMGVNWLGSTDISEILEHPEWDFKKMCDESTVYTYFCQIGEAVLQYGGSLGHPDTVLQGGNGNYKYFPGQLLEMKLKDQVPVIPNCQTAVSEIAEAGMFRKLISELGANYIVWWNWSSEISSYYSNRVKPFLEKQELMEVCYSKKQGGTLSSSEKNDCDNLLNELENEWKNPLNQGTVTYMEQFETHTYYDWVYQNLDVPEITCKPITVASYSNCLLCPNIKGCPGRNKTREEIIKEIVLTSVFVSGGVLVGLIVLISFIVVLTFIICYSLKKKRGGEKVIKITSTDELIEPSSKCEVEEEFKSESENDF